ncbi:MAG: cupin domain-containing protein [Actinomycetes bacterium]
MDGVPEPFVVAVPQVLAEQWGSGSPGSVSWTTLVSADRTPSAGLTVGVAEISPGAPDQVFLHRHEPPEVYQVLSGRGEVVVDDAVLSVAAGSTVFIPGGAWHSARNTGSEPLRLMYVFAVDEFGEVVYEFLDGDPAGGAS